MKTTIENEQFDEERALYNLTNTLVRDCVFAGPAFSIKALIRLYFTIHATFCQQRGSQ